MASIAGGAASTGAGGTKVKTARDLGFLPPAASWQEPPNVLVKSRKQLCIMATAAEKARRYDDMVEIAVQIARLSLSDKDPVTPEEQVLLCSAFKNFVGDQRAAWRMVNALRKRAEDRKTYGAATAQEVDELADYEQSVQAEIMTTCTALVSMLDKLLEAGNLDFEARVVLFKMSGDFNRYMAEVNPRGSVEFIATGETAHAKYTQAKRAADAADMKPTSTTRLGLALNFSVFLYEIAEDVDGAIDVAKQAFDEAMDGLADMTDAAYKETTLAMQLLRDNIKLWSRDIAELEEQTAQAAAAAKQGQGSDASDDGDDGDGDAGQTNA